MPETYKILSVEQVYDRVWWCRNSVRFYRVVYDHSAGQRVLRLPWYKFYGTPRVGDRIEYVRGLNCLYGDKDWKIHNQRGR